MKPADGISKYGPARIAVSRIGPEDLKVDSPPPVLGLLLILVIILLASLTALANNFEYSEKEAVDMVVRMSPDSSIITAPGDGYVSTLLVQEGQFVNKGQKLLLTKRPDEIKDTIEAPVEGSVQLLLPLSRGERISRGDALLAIVPGKTSLMASGFVELRVGERLRVGQEVSLFGPEIIQNRVAARITSLGPPHVDARRRVDVMVLGSSTSLMPGTRVRAEIAVVSGRLLQRLFQRMRSRGI